MNYLKKSYVKTCKNLHVYRMDCRKRLSRTRDSRIGGSIDSSFKQTNRKDADLTLRNLIGWHTSEPRVLDYCVDLNSCAYTLSVWVTNLTILLGMASKQQLIVEFIFWYQLKLHTNFHFEPLTNLHCKKKQLSLTQLNSNLENRSI